MCHVKAVIPRMISMKHHPWGQGGASEEGRPTYCHNSASWAQETALVRGFVDHPHRVNPPTSVAKKGTIVRNEKDKYERRYLNQR